MSESTLNPSIREIMVGNRTLRKIKIYPLSAKDEIDMGTLITKAIVSFSERSKEFDELAGPSIISNSSSKLEVINECLRLVVDNIQEILKIVSDIPEEEVEEVALSMTNAQIMGIAIIIWDDNYGVVQKNVQDLLEKVRGKAAPSA